MLDQKWAYLVYAGLWWEPLRTDLDAYMDAANAHVTGKIGVKLYKGSARVVTRDSPNAVYDAAAGDLPPSGPACSRQAASPGLHRAVVAAVADGLAGPQQKTGLMSSAPEEMLVQRQLRAAEIALETARKRRFETDEEVVELRVQVADLNAALQALGVEQEEGARELRMRVAELQAELAVSRRYVLDERAARLAAEQELTDLRREAWTREETVAQLTSQQRIEELEGELELVLRRATEFEYGVRMALGDAFTSSVYVLRSALLQRNFAPPYRAESDRKQHQQQQSNDND